MKFSGGAKKEKKEKIQKEAKKTKNVKKTKSADRREGRKTAKKVVVASLIAVVVILGALISIGAYANGMENIYPNVSFEGIDLSGMTDAEAADALSRGGIGAGDDKELNVSLPASVELVVSAREAGAYLSAPDAAVFVYEKCHGGSFLGNTITYFRCLFGGLELSISDGAELNEAYLNRVIDDAAKQVQLALLESSVEIGEESITVIKGASSVQVDSNELFENVKSALLEGKYAPMEYDAVATGVAAEEIDLEDLYDTVFLEPVNAVYDPETESATESISGRSFDITEARRTWDEASPGDTVVIPLIIEEPEITTEKLNNMLFADLLAQKSTSLSGSSYARINNIKKACEAITGLVLNPGEEFSYNGIVGERTTAKGYMAAGAYNNGKVVQETGGGICQVSSTIYYCALISNMEITNRQCHMFGVAYLPPGLDATVSWPAPDFKFKNSSKYPIRIEASVDSSTNSCVIKIYGSNPDGIRVEMTTASLSYPDGYGAISYRWVYDKDGNLISKTEEARSRYYYHDEDEESPSPSPSPSASPDTSPSPGTSPSPSQPVSPSPTVPVTPSDPVTPPPDPVTPPPDPVTPPPDPGGTVDG